LPCGAPVAAGLATGGPHRADCVRDYHRPRRRRLRRELGGRAVTSPLFQVGENICLRDLLPTIGASSPEHRLCLSVRTLRSFGFRSSELSTTFIVDVEMACLFWILSAIVTACVLLADRSCRRSYGCGYDAYNPLNAYSGLVQDAGGSSGARKVQSVGGLAVAVVGWVPIIRGVFVVVWAETVLKALSKCRDAIRRILGVSEKLSP
jgi:hypothetical protein